ncbi:MAG: hypothetical protein ISS82_02810 [Nanoarchaeota archaeon]|nr:hypothetical protein [Nanoarchaeota archaeon]
MQAPFVCKDVKVIIGPGGNNIIYLVMGATGTSEITYDNTADKAITINGGEGYMIIDDGDGGGSAGYTSPAENLQQGQIVTIISTTLTTFTHEVGDKYSGTITLSYTKTNSDVTHEVIGQFSGTVEEGTVE